MNAYGDIMEQFVVFDLCMYWKFSSFCCDFINVIEIILFIDRKSISDF